MKRGAAERVTALTLALTLVSASARAQQAPPSSAAPAPALAQVAPAVTPPWWFTLPPPGQRNVYFEATDPDAQLELRMPRASGPPAWRTVCVRAPCIARVQIGAEYRVSGPGVESSRTFRVYPNPGPFALRARAGSSTARVVGYVLLSTGVVATIVGGFMMAEEGISCWGCTEDERSRAMDPGGAALVSGLIALAVGIGFAVANKTSLDFGLRKLRLLRPPYVPGPEAR